MAFAPGKVILLGEHAVVYGTPALAGALASGVYAEAKDGEPSVRNTSTGEIARPGDGTPLGEAYGALLATLGIAGKTVEVRFDLWPSSGLGSSAALAVAVARALVPDLPRDRLLDAAMASETVFHGRPSGIDASVAAHGGLGRYTRYEGFRPLAAAREVPLLVGHTGKQRDTRGRVARVAQLLDERPDETRARFAAIAGLVEKAADAIARGDWGTLGAAMDENQRHLAALEVSSPEIERMCAVARDAGALGAKLTGGGGGGCVIVLAPGREQAVADAWDGLECFVTTVGGAA